MTLDEAIKHAEEVADLCEYEASKYDMNDFYESHVACQEGKCAEEHRQLAEWLKELRRLKEQEPKTGHWILADEQRKEDVENDNYLFICSECKCSDIHAKGTKVPYCWRCGTKMEIEE